MINHEENKKNRKENNLNNNELKSKIIDVPILGKHHINSFDYAFNGILPILHKYIRPMELNAPENCKNIFEKLVVSFEGFELEKPVIETKTETGTVIKETLYPSECREREMNYSAPIFAKIRRKFDTTVDEIFNVKLGSIPVMVKSSFCNLHNLNNEQCVKLKEDNADFGGYFIVNGNEKLLRMLSIPRRNYPIGFVRPSYTKKTKNCSEYAVQIKCVREDLTSQSMTFHYLNDGNCLLRLLLRKQEYLIPAGLLLKALVDSSDMYIYSKLLYDPSNVRLKESIEVLIADVKKFGLSKQEQYLEYIGIRFRDLMGFTNNLNITNEEIGKLFIKDYIFINLNNNVEKFNAFCVCLEKMYMLAFKQIKPDNMDSPLNHEILLSGHLYMMVLKEKLEDVLQLVKTKLVKTLNSGRKKPQQILHFNFIKSEFDASNISKRMENFLATGNLISKSGLDLMQMGGYSILAEKLNNMRYLSHFRSVHRGQFFTEMKTTTPRKLLPDSWGFLCPVHTPDGSPCGLLNHLASGCDIITHQNNTIDFKKNIIQTCSEFGMIPIEKNTLNLSFDHHYVILDGNPVGFVRDKITPSFINNLRYSKIHGLKNIPQNMEIGFIPKTRLINSKIETDTNHFQYPGIFLFTCIARMIRAVKNLEYNEEEIIGTIEQQYLNIACLPEDFKYNHTTHQEIDVNNFLSMVASITPFCEYNQSPRNMYQCQMAKQTMGTPYFNYPHRVDNKTYRILFPQIPLVHTNKFHENGFESNPSGTNAVVAVLSYTGYDMEDAMIINKSSYERGFGHGAVYKSVTKILNESGKGFSVVSTKYRMLNLNSSEDRAIVANSKLKSLPDYIGSDGLPYIGTHLVQGSLKMAYLDTVKNEVILQFYKDMEPCYVDQIRIYNKGINPDEVCINFLLRFKRNPIIGDKFSSRHGQKGVMSFLWPSVNMPFTESGITPDVLINPHAFPSRMTIGMLIESLAGKAGSMQGKFKQFETFKKAENDDLICNLGEELIKEGFNFNGTEVLYSGVSGNKLVADIYIGVVYYQRLRHMVNDKAQARSTGPIDILTRQPVKGRKNNGGIRFGEMERDGLLAHGVSYCLNDRLFKSSDYSEGFICTNCNNLLSVHFLNKNTWINNQIKNDLRQQESQEKVDIAETLICENCKESKCEKVSIPYVLRYLTNELAGMNIKMSFKLKAN